MKGSMLQRKKLNRNNILHNHHHDILKLRLVKTLEELGIGRPSTYAPTLDTIQRSGYVALENRRFVPTELGEIVIQLISEFFPEIINVEFTAKMEKESR